MSRDVYAWMDPWEAERQAYATGERRGRTEGYSQGQSAAIRQFTQGPLAHGIQRGAEKLGEEMGRQPEVQEAVRTVMEGLRQNANYDVGLEERHDTMEQVVIQTVNVRPFRVNYGLAFSPSDMGRYR